ncbi:hypothetical protein ACQP1W_13995 [Spirillospora sp. CA-255316]
MASRVSLYVVTALAASAGLALLPAAPLALRDRVPDPLASHWGVDGTPDGSASFTSWLVLVGAVWLIFCGGALAVGLRGWGRRRVRAWTGATLGFGAGVTAGAVAATLGANLDRATWREAGGLGGGTMALVLLGAAAVAGVGWLLGNVGSDRLGTPPPAATPRMDPRADAVGAGRRPVWIGYAHSRWAVWLCGAMAVAGVVGALSAVLLPEPLTPGRPLALPLLALVLSGLAGLTLSSARVTVDGRGLTVAFGPLGWPVRRIPVARVSSAWAEDRSPSQVGGWGYRVRGDGTTVMLRGGECLVVQHDGGARFAVSVDDAERGAALLNALRE